MADSPRSWFEGSPCSGTDGQLLVLRDGRRWKKHMAMRSLIVGHAMLRRWEWTLPHRRAVGACSTFARQKRYLHIGLQTPPSSNGFPPAGLRPSGIGDNLTNVKSGTSEVSSYLGNASAWKATWYRFVINILRYPHRSAPVLV